MDKTELLLRQLGKARYERDLEAERILPGELGNEYFALGNLERALEFYEQALTITHLIGDPYGESATTLNWKEM